MIDVFNLPEDKRGTLLAILQQIFSRVIKFDYNCAFSVTVCQLDKCLQDILPQDKMIINAVGVFTITNNEFRDLMSQLIRHIKIQLTRQWTLTWQHHQLILKVVLGVVQKSPVDGVYLFPNFMPEQRTIPISYTDLMMTVLKASLRSACLKTSLKSLSLFERVMDMDEILQIG